VTVTDALEAGALEAFGTSTERAVLAARAGMDLILCAARDVAQGRDVTAGLASALDSGQLNPAGFAAALHRVTSLRAALPKARRWRKSSDRPGPQRSGHRLGRLTTMPSWLLRAMTTTASSSPGFSSRCGT